MTKRRVVLLFGGRSAEHDVSRTSAVTFLRALDPDRFDVLPIGISPEGAWSVSDSALALHRRESGTELLAQVELGGASTSPLAALPTAGAADALHTDDLPVVIPVLHGPNGEDGTVQGMLELAGVPYVGPGVLGSAVSMDKSVAKVVLAAAGIPQAKWLTRRSWDLSDGAAVAAFTSETVDCIGWPVFVKPANMGSSVGVSKADSAESFRSALELAMQFDDTVVVEETIVGREIEFAVLGNDVVEVSSAGEIFPGAAFYDYEDKYVLDNANYAIPATLTTEQLAEGKRLAEAAYRALRCEGMARVDFFLDDGSTGGDGRGWIINEANTIPGFTPISMYPKLWEAAGVSHAQLVEKLIDLAVDRFERRRGRVGRSRHR
jgi:D-alanine-D-alanine ligase